mmetsp:Transcript_97065/g.251079  ORF Transcript_97065/g.251079 Transcript_97065/m.251079 type:complete len:505 (-) Transcript_97065:48-1562(-)
MALAAGRLCHGVPDLRPEVVDAAEALGASEHNVHVDVRRQLVANGLCRGIGHPPCTHVDLGDDDGVAHALPLSAGQQVDKLLVCRQQLLVARITEVEDVHERLPLLEVAVDQLRPRPRDTRLHTSVAQAGGIHKHEVWQARALPVHLVEVQRARPRFDLRAGRQLRKCAEERVDHRRLARVRAADEDDLGSLPGPVRRHLAERLRPLQQRKLRGASSAEEVDGHVIPGDAQLVHDLTRTQGLWDQARAAVPADDLVEGLSQHQVPPVRCDGKHVIADAEELLHLQGHLSAMGSQELGVVLRCCLQVQGGDLQDALHLAGTSSDVFGPPALPLELREVERSLHGSGLGEGVRHVPKRLVAARRLAIGARRQLRCFLVLLELDQRHRCPATCVAFLLRHAQAHDAAHITHAEVRRHQLSDSIATDPREALPLRLRLLRLQGQVLIPLHRQQHLRPGLQLGRLRDVWEHIPRFPLLLALGYLDTGDIGAGPSPKPPQPSSAAAACAA